MFALMVPLALLLSVQTCPAGWVLPVTVSLEPLAYDVANVCVLFAVKVSESPLLSCTTSVPVRPETATLIVKFVCAALVAAPAVKKRVPNTASNRRLQDFIRASTKFPRILIAEYSRYVSNGTLRQRYVTGRYKGGKVSVVQQFWHVKACGARLTDHSQFFDVKCAR